jgi:mRNA interferase RelE/StbE
MAWAVELSVAAEREIEKLDPQTARRILRFLHEQVARLDDPRSIGWALRGSQLGDLWKYRVGDYRIIGDLQDRRVVILMLHVGNGREVYR